MAKISEKKVEQFAVKRHTEEQGLGLTAETIAVECKGHTQIALNRKQDAGI